MFTKVELQGDYTVVHISGRLDIDKANAFKQACLLHLKGKKVIFSLEKLTFVGSTGITNFFQTIKDIDALNEVKCRVAGLSNDFKRVLTLFNVNELVISETIEHAIASIERPYEFQNNIPLGIEANSLDISKLNIIESAPDVQVPIDAELMNDEISLGVDFAAVRNS